MAVARDAFAPLPALAALTGALLIQVGTNLANDYYDFVRGGDRPDRLGPVRVTQSGLIPPETVKRGAALVFGVAVLVGAYLVAVGGWPILLVGLASLISGVAYTGGPYPLAYHGLGDLFVFVFFGLVAVAGTYYVQALELRPEVLWGGMAMGALNTAILVVNNLRDVETDAEAGKRTLAVMLGVRRTKVEYVALLFLAWAAPPVGIVFFGWGRGSLLAWASLPLAWAPLCRVLRYTDARELNPALGGTARLVAAYGILLAAGLALG
jgi:1,4-dihydroxy-2-naphthoate octaprenyltransferase